MSDSGFVVLDTRAFDEAIAETQALIRSYQALNQKYDDIINQLMENWKGRGATAFHKDATTVKTNIVSIYDILSTMCDTLRDCKEIFAECDAGLGDYNRNPDA